MMTTIYFVLPLLVGLSQASTPNSPSYEAGVVEFSYGRNQELTPEEKLKFNLDQYLKIMDDESSGNLDIIVFPEMTLNDMKTAVETPEPTDKISPCHDPDYPADLVKNISCSAKRNNFYVVVNAVTKAVCPDADMKANNDPRNCSNREDGFSYYNTNLVFDRNGTLISRYRKFNLFGEEVDKPFKPSMISFETDFGVKFGHFICFDLMFRYPALSLVKDHGITDIVFPTMWFSELPFLTASQVQKNWAYANKVNLLAAGANNPDKGSTGTGIYAGEKGALQSVMNGKFETKFYRATVLKQGSASVEVYEKHSAQEMASLELKRDQLDVYNIKYLEDTVSETNSNTVELCHNDLCCTFNYKYTVNRSDQKPYYRYALAVYHGVRSFDGFANGGIVTCAVLACASESISTCGERNEKLKYAHEWSELSIEGNFPHDADRQRFFYLPTTLDSSIMPLKVNQFKYSEIETQTNDGIRTLTISMRKQVNLNLTDLYSFGIYGRDFSMDSIPKNEPDAAEALKTFFLLVLMLAAALTLQNI